MSTAIKVICCLIVLAAILPWLVFAGFAPMMFDAGDNMTKLQKLSATGVLIATWATPVWVAIFGWQTIRTWGSSGPGSAILMALPGALLIAAMVLVQRLA